MGVNSLVEVGLVSQVEVTGDLFDQYRTAMSGDYVPRTGGIPTTLGGDIGTSTYKFKDIFANGFTVTNSGAVTTGNTVTISGLTICSDYQATTIQSAYLDFNLANDQMGEFNINIGRSGNANYGTFGKWLVYNPNGTFSINTISTQDAPSGNAGFDIYQPSAGVVRVINTSTESLNIRVSYWRNSAI